MNKLLILILCLLCFAAYLNSLSNNFVFDDEVLIVKNPLIKSVKFIPRIFINPVSEYLYGNMYRPMQLLTYNADYRIWGLRPAGFRLANLILHLLNGILVYYLLNMLFGNQPLSAMAGILFLIHPVHVSVVAYIAGRADLLAGFFMLLSLLLFVKFIREKSRISYVVSLVSAWLALLSRENALLLFVFIALTIFILAKRGKYYLFLVPFIFLDAGYLLLRLFIFKQGALTLHPEFITGLPLRIINFFNIAVKYLSILILPLDLHMFRTTAFIKTMFDIRSIYVCGFISLIIFMFIKFRVNKLLLFGSAWFFTGLIPVYLYFDGYPAFNKAVMAESWLYLSSIGFFVLTAFLCVNFKKIGSILFLIFAAFYVFSTTIYTRYFKNEIIFYENVLSYNGEANPLRKGLIKAYLEKGLYAEAFRQIQEFGRYYPESRDFYLYCGLYHSLAGNIEKAIEAYNLALAKGRDQYVYYNLSVCYEQLGQLDKAIQMALECYALNPGYLPNLIKLGDLYLRQNNFNEAGKYRELASEHEGR